MMAPRDADATPVPGPDDTPITAFTGRWRFLSNFYRSEFRAVIDLGDQSLSIRVPTLEHAYQASKATTLAIARRIIDEAGSALEARRMGRRLVLRPDWDQVRVPTMRALVQMKFAEVYLAERLLATGERELVEGNPWKDTFWGAVPSVKPTQAASQLNPGEQVYDTPSAVYIGQNWLGRILMERRSALRAERGK